MVLLLRRLIVLLAIGLMHLCLIWNGDILTEYALAGFIVLPLLFGPRWLLAAPPGVSRTVSCDAGLFRRRDCGPARPRWRRMSRTRTASIRRADFSTCWRSGCARCRFSCPARLYLSAHGRAVSARRLRLAHRHSAKPATPSAVRDRRRRHRPRRGIDPCPCRQLYRRRPDRRPGRTARHHPAGAGLWRCHHRHCQPRRAERGCSAGPRRWGAWPSPTTWRNP